MAATVGATVGVGVGSGNPGVATFAHTLNADTNLLVVGVAVNVSGRDVSSVTWNGTPLTRSAADFFPNISTVRRIVFFYLASPTGSGNVVVTLSAGSGTCGAVAVNILGADASNPFGTHATVVSSFTNGLTTPSMAGDLFIDMVLLTSANAPTKASGQTALDGRGSLDSDGTIVAAVFFGMSYKAVAGPATMGWNSNSSSMGILAVPINSGSDIDVAGSIDGVSDLSGSLTADLALAGSIDGVAALSGALTTILGPAGLVAIQKRGVMRAGIWVVAQSPPFSLIREIRTAVNVDRIKPLDEPGRLSFDISPREGEAPHDYATAGGSNLGDGLYLPPDLIREGTFLVDFSSELIEPWLWYVQTIAYDSDKASVQAVEVRGLFGERTLPEGSSFGSKGAAAVANVLLAQANGRNPTYIVPGSSSALRVVIPTGQATDFSRQNVLAAFDALAAFAASDWWVSYAVSRSGIRPTLQLGRRGSDRRGEVILTEGVELRAVSYARDAREVPRFVRFVQDSQGPAGGMATETPVGYRTGGQVQLAPEFHLRRALRKHGPALSAEQLRVYPQNTTDITLVGAALRSLQTSEAAVQTVELTLRQPPERFDVDGLPLARPQARTPWSAFGLGDTVTVRLSSPQFFAGVDVTLRITALQPDEAAGEMILVGDIIE